MKVNCHKKVLLRERKRHTARRVVTTHSVVLSWLTPPPPVGWTWPPLSAGPDPPPLLAGPEPPPCWLDLTPAVSYTWPPPLLAGPDPPPSWTWPPPPLAGLTPPPRLDLTPPRLDLTPPPPVDRQNHGWMDRRVSKHYLPVVLRTRAVNIKPTNWSCKCVNANVQSCRWFL